MRWNALKYFFTAFAAINAVLSKIRRIHRISPKNSPKNPGVQKKFNHSSCLVLASRHKLEKNSIIYKKRKSSKALRTTISLISTLTSSKVITNFILLFIFKFSFLLITLVIIITKNFKRMVEWHKQAENKSQS